MSSVAKAILEETGDFVMSTADAINTIGDGFVGAVLDPVGTADKIINVVEHPIDSAVSVGQTVAAVGQHIGNATVHTYNVLTDPNASAEDKARAGTQAVLQVGSLLVGGGGARALVSGAKVTNQAIKVERVVAASSKGSRAAEALAAAEARLGGASSQLARDLNKVAQVPHVTDAALKEILEGSHALFRARAEIGNGGTAAAVRHTKETATLVGNSDHIQKLANKQTELTNWLLKNANNANVSAHDVSVARRLLEETIETQAQLHSAAPHVQNMARAALLAREQEAEVERQVEKQDEMEERQKQQEQQKEEQEKKEQQEQQEQQEQEQEEQEEQEERERQEQEEEEKAAQAQAEIDALETELAAEERQLTEEEQRAEQDNNKADECEQAIEQLESQLKQAQAAAANNDDKNKDSHNQKQEKIQQMIEQLRRRSSQHRSSASKHRQRAQQSKAKITSLQSSIQSLRARAQTQSRARATAR